MDDLVLKWKDTKQSQIACCWVPPVSTQRFVETDLFFQEGISLSFRKVPMFLLKLLKIIMDTIGIVDAGSCGKFFDFVCPISDLSFAELIRILLKQNIISNIRKNFIKEQIVLILGHSCCF